MKKILEKTSSFSQKNYLAKVIFSSSFFTFFSKVLLFFQSLLITRHFGITKESDLYFFCFTSVNFIAVFFTAIDSSIILHRVIEYIQENDRKKAIQMINNMLFVYLSMMLVLLLIFNLKPGTFFSFFISGNFEAISIQSTLGISLFLVSYILLNSLSTYAQAFGVYAILAKAEIISTLCAIGYVIGDFKYEGVYGVFIIMATVNLLTLCILCIKYKIRFHWNLSMLNFQLFEKSLRRELLFFNSGNILVLFSSMFPAFILGKYQAGYITIYNYTQQILAIPRVIFATQLSNIIGVKMSENHKLKNLKYVNTIFNKSSIVLIILAIISMSLFLISSEYILNFIFYLKKPSDIAYTETLIFVRLFFLSIPFTAVQIMTARLYFSTSNAVLSIYNMIFSQLIYIVFLYLFSTYFKINGFALAFVLSNVLNVYISFLLVRKKIPGINIRFITKTLNNLLFLNFGLFGFLIYIFKSSEISNLYWQFSIGFAVVFLNIFVGNRIFRRAMNSI